MLLLFISVTTTGSSEEIIYSRELSKIPERYEKCFLVSSSLKGNYLPAPPSGRECATSYTANVGGDLMNPGIRILPLPSANGLLEWPMSG